MAVPTITTAFGPRYAAEPPRHVIPPIPADALRFAERIDREADQLLAQGRCLQAERLAHLALEARCRATGTRA